MKIKPRLCNRCGCLLASSIARRCEACKIARQHNAMIAKRFFRYPAVRQCSRCGCMYSAAYRSRRCESCRVARRKHAVVAQQFRKRTSRNRRSQSAKVGDTFGEWTVIGTADEKKRVPCRCACGKEKEVYATLLYRGKSTSCRRCSAKRIAARDGGVPKSIKGTAWESRDRVGERHGRWTVIGPRREHKRNTQWRCRCDCGYEAWRATAQQLRSHRDCQLTPKRLRASGTR
jgi:hypothetical protein